MTAIEGGCYCGAIRYRLNGPIAGTAACHCRKCQYGAGGGANHSALVARDAFELLRGTPVAHASKADSGTEVVRTFCGTCGTPLYSDTPNLPFRAVRVGSLDDGSRMAPSVHVWMEAAPPWHLTEPNAVCFVQGPGSRRL
ncbi:MAG: GFA family protein [Alphaproteobacteria bacterium]|nr:GFA family protein [Alphaproteobacteria bacterium]